MNPNNPSLRNVRHTFISTPTRELSDLEEAAGFEALLIVAERVAIHYNGDLQKMFLWWYTTQAGLNGCTPEEAAMEMHGDKITQLMGYLKDKELIDE